MVDLHRDFRREVQNEGKITMGSKKATFTLPYIFSFINPFTNARSKYNPMEQSMECSKTKAATESTVGPVLSLVLGLLLSFSESF